MLENKSHNETFDTNKSLGLSGRDRFVTDGPECLRPQYHVTVSCKWHAIRGTTYPFQSHISERKKIVTLSN